MRRQDKGPRQTPPFTPEERAARRPKGRVSRWAAVFLALVLVAGVSIAQNLISGGSANPQTGPASLTSLTVGFVDAGTVWLGAGAVAAPSLSFSVDPDTGLYRSAANSVAIAAGGALQLTVDTSGTTVSAGHYLAMGSASRVLLDDGATAAAPALTFAGDQNTGLYKVGADQLGVVTAGTRSFNFSATPGVLEGVTGTPKLTLDNSAGAKLEYTGSSIRAATNTVLVSGSAGLDVTAGTPFTIGQRVVFSGATPTISSGFGTSPSVTAGYATAFRVNVGTGGTANSGVIALGITATNGWNCTCADLTTQSATVFLCKQTASSTTTATIGNFNTAGAAAAWVDSDILAVTCTGL